MKKVSFLENSFIRLLFFDCGASRHIYGNENLHQLLNPKYFAYTITTEYKIFCIHTMLKNVMELSQNLGFTPKIMLSTTDEFPFQIKCVSGFTHNICPKRNYAGVKLSK